MINSKDLDVMPKATRVSFLQSHITAQNTYIATLKSTGDTAGAYNDAVQELARLNYHLTNAKLA
jgi:hypothetical protein